MSRKPRDFILPVFFVGLALNFSHTALGNCWKEGPSWAKFKVCDSEKPVRDLAREGKNLINQTINSVCAVPYKNYVSGVAASCLMENAGSVDINETKNTLVRAGFFKESDFSGVSFKFCKLISYSANGMAPIPNTVLISSAFKDHSLRTLVPLVAHEMQHILQMREMGFDDFSCYYSQEIVKKGSATFLEKNKLEKQAYEKEASVETYLSTQFAQSEPLDRDINYSYRAIGGQVWTNEPAAMTSLGDSLYVIENQSLYRVSPTDGSYTSLGKNWTIGPILMTALGSSLYIIENSTLYRVSPTDGSYTSLGKNWTTNPVALTSLNNFLYIIENNTLYRVSPSDGSYTNLGANWSVGPIGMTALSNRLYIVENGTLYNVDPNNGNYVSLGTNFAPSFAGLVAKSGYLYGIDNQTLWRVDSHSGSYHKLGKDWFLGPILMTTLNSKIYIIADITQRVKAFQNRCLGYGLS